MKLGAIFLTALAVLAASQAAMAVLAIAIVAGIIVGVIARPREMLTLLGIAVIGELIQAQPVLSLAVTALAIIAGLLRRNT